MIFERPSEPNAVARLRSRRRIRASRVILKTIWTSPGPRRITRPPPNAQHTIQITPPAVVCADGTCTPPSASELGRAVVYAGGAPSQSIDQVRTQSTPVETFVALITLRGTLGTLETLGARQQRISATHTQRDINTTRHKYVRTYASRLPIR